VKGERLQPAWKIASNLDAKVVQERMGHASIQTTLQLYAKATPAALERSAEVMGGYLAGSGIRDNQPSSTE
jgi:integrase